MPYSEPEASAPGPNLDIRAYPLPIRLVPAQALRRAEHDLLSTIRVAAPGTVWRCCGILWGMASEVTSNQQQPSRPEPNTTAVRFGKMRHVGEFSYPADMKFEHGGKLIVSTDRGIEIGEQVLFACPSECSVKNERMRAYAESSGGEVYRLRCGRILRHATENDLAEYRHIQRDARNKLRVCQDFTAELDLPMNVVDCEHLFGGERIVFYFMSEERVDFRELVRRLAEEFQTRIEMRQIGARDEARLLADYETCGRRCCCQGFLKTLKPVSMSMAKVQKATLDPSKVSGRCGRLKCCLRYEHESYDELAERLPRMGSRVATADAVGFVIDRQILTQLVRIRTDDDRIIVVSVDEIVERNLPNRPAPPPVENGEDNPRPPRRNRDRGGGNGDRGPRRNDRGRNERSSRPGGNLRKAEGDSEPPPPQPPDPDLPEDPGLGNNEVQ